MKTIKLGLLATTLLASSLAMAKGDTAINLMALSSSNTSIESLAPLIREQNKGVITDIELEDVKDKYVVYEFELVDIKANTEYELHFDIRDQKLTKERSDSLSFLGFSKLEKEERSAIEQVTKAEFDILKALTALEEKYAARVINAELEEENGYVFYKVKLASPEKGIQKLLLNVDNGEEFPILKRHKK